VRTWSSRGPHLLGRVVARRIGSGELKAPVEALENRQGDPDRGLERLIGKLEREDIVPIEEGRLHLGKQRVAGGIEPGERLAVGTCPPFG
jgi:hypothetical protein